jgi:hypothetical protein
MAVAAWRPGRLAIVIAVFRTWALNVDGEALKS